MTKDEALKLALEALKQIDEAMPFPVAKLAQKAIKEALAQPEQKPVAYLAWKEGKPCYEGDDAVCEDAVWPVDIDDDRTSMPVYTTPPQRTWVGLDSEEIRKAKHHMVEGAYQYSFKQGAEWAEAKLKEKNT